MIPSICVQDDDIEVDKLPDDTFLRVIESTLLSDLSLKGIPGIKKVNFVECCFTESPD